MVGLIASGEGWHNNPHADPRSARHATAAGNTTWLTIRFLAWLGLASDVVAPSAHLTARPKGSRLTTRGPTGVPADPDAYS